METRSENMEKEKKNIYSPFSFVAGIQIICFTFHITTMGYLNAEMFFWGKTHWNDVIVKDSLLGGAVGGEGIYLMSYLHP